jgi:polyisoprenoid-binding protein YceI
MKRFFIPAILFILWGNFAAAAEYKIDATQSTLTFSGTHAGNIFNGVFKKWTGKILFDAKHLETSSLDVTIDTTTAETGNVLYDLTLPTEDWFAVKAYPAATFKSVYISKNSLGSYTVAGTLTIRNIQKPIRFTFTLTPDDESSPTAKVTFTLPVDRLAFDIGKDSDAKADWVGRTIDIHGVVIANAL